VPSVFLSYSHNDILFVRELHRRLTRDGVTCFFDEESIEWGANWVLTLENALDTCDFFVPILSPDFVRSKWVELERTSALADDPAGTRRKTRPLLLRDCDVPRFLKPIQTIDVSAAALFESNYPKICRALGGTVRPDPTPPTDRTALPPVTPLRPPFHMPFRSIEAQFVGRIDALWTVFDQLSHGKTSIVQGVGVVYGAGGLGKTQLAVEYVHRFNLHYPGGVFWIEADQGIPRLINVLSASAEIEVDGRLKEPDQLATIWTALTRRPAILLVLDNFPESVPLAPWLPPAGDIHVLVTTRRRDLTRYPRLTLPVLTPDEGQRLLNRFDTESRALVEDVGGLPLALELLRAYLDTTPGITSADLRRAIQETGAIPQLDRFAADYRDDLPTQHERNVAATIQLSWNLASEDAKDVLHVMSHLAPAPVPVRLIRAALGWPEAAALDDRLAVARKDLWRLSLIEIDPQNQPSAHRLLLGFVRHLPDGNSHWTETVTAIENEMHRARDDRDTASYQELEAVLPHAEAVLARSDLPSERGVEIVGDLGRHHKTLGRFQLAKPFYREALARAERNCPPGDPEIATRQSNLAVLLKDLGELTDARDLLRKALAADERSFPAGGTEIAIKQSNLALVLRNLGELPEARDLLRKALASDEQSYPAGHHTIAIRQSNLALVLQDLGELAEARDLAQKALTSDEQSFPADHPRIATLQSNLAMVLQDLGELAEARDLAQKALASDEQSFPAGHPNIAIRQSNLAMVLQALGEIPEARDLAQKAYDSSLAQLGPDHPNTRTIKRNLDSLSALTSAS
jgi:tetratricopeptide (TPR) repeat protein